MTAMPRLVQKSNKIMKYKFSQGIVHKLRLQNFMIFDHLPTLKFAVQYLKVCNFLKFLTTHPPMIANVICEPPLMPVLMNQFFVWTGLDSAFYAPLLKKNYALPKNVFEKIIAHQIKWKTQPYIASQLLVYVQNTRGALSPPLKSF